MAILGRKKNSKRMYGMILIGYLVACAIILIVGFWDGRNTVEEYNVSQANLVSGLLVENVNVALDHVVGQVEEVSYVIVGGRENAPDIIYEELQVYAKRSDMNSVGFIDPQLNIYGKSEEQQDLVKQGTFQQAMAAHETTVTDPFRSRISGEMEITIFVPVYQSGRHAGMVYANFPLNRLQDYANMDGLSGQAHIYLINCHSLNSISCSDTSDVKAGTWNNLALRRTEMEFDATREYEFYIAKMQNGVKGGTVRYQIDGVDYTQGYERIDKMKGWYLAVEFSDEKVLGSFHAFRDKLLIYGLLFLLVTLITGVTVAACEMLQKKKFEKLSSTDAMTGLYNKKTFSALVEEYLYYENDPGTLIFVDVDDFKIYNDKYGHLNGDSVLKKIARELQEEFLQNGIVGRYGGDEFTVFLKHTASKEYVDGAMERLQKKLSSIELDGEGEVSLFFSAGGARYPQDGTTFAELCKLADQALYRVKAEGKGSYGWYEEGEK